MHTRDVMIPGLGSILESDFQHFPIPNPAIIDFLTVLELILGTGTDSKIGYLSLL